MRATAHRLQQEVLGAKEHQQGAGRDARMVVVGGDGGVCGHMMKGG